MYENTVTVGFLRCKPNVYEFLYNLFVNFQRHVLYRRGTGFDRRKIVFFVL